MTILLLITDGKDDMCRLGKRFLQGQLKGNNERGHEAEVS